jgi:hypothetical protein
MISSFYKVVIASLIILLTAAPGFARTQMPSYEFQEFTLRGTDFETADYAVPVKINDNNDVVGYAGIGGTIKAFLYSLETGVLEEIDVPGACSIVPAGLNNLGQVVGTYGTGNCLPGDPTHAFLRDVNGTIYTIDIPGSLSTSLRGIADSGVITGSVSFSSQEHEHGYVRVCLVTPLLQSIFPLLVPCTPPTFFDAPGVGTFSTTPQDIDNDLSIAGEYLDHPESNRQHGFLRNPRGKFISIDFPGMLGTSASGLSTKWVVGFSYAADLVTHGFLWSGTNFYTVEPVGAAWSFAIDINKFDVLIEAAGDAGGPHWYIGTPHAE